MQQNVNEPVVPNIPQIQLVYPPGSPDDPKQVIADDKAYKVVKDSWNLETIELVTELKGMYLNAGSELPGIYPVSSGGRGQAVGGPRLIFAGSAHMRRRIHHSRHQSSIRKPAAREANR